MQVFILGMHRSGTSALARVLNLMGLYFGEEDAGTGRSSENEKGFWERRDVRMINDSILFTSKCDWDLLAEFDPGLIPDTTKEGHASAIADVVTRLDAHRPWFVKEPRLCVTFPIWRSALEQPLCIHISRNPLEVAHSLKARNRIPIRVGLALWELYNVHALQAATQLPLLRVTYEDLVGDPDRTSETVRVFLTEHGSYPMRNLTASELSGSLDSKLRHHQKEASALSRVATKDQLDLYRRLVDSTAPIDAPRAVSEGSLDTLRKYERTANVDDRRRAATESTARRRRSHLELQIALRGVELRHALAAQQRVELETKRLQTTGRALEIQLATSNERVRTQRDHIRTLQDDIRTLRDDIRTHRDHIRTLQQRTASHDQLLARHEKLKQDLDQKRRRGAELERSCRRNQRELGELKPRYAEALAQVRHESRELRKADRQYAELNVRWLRAERELDHHRRLVARLQALRSDKEGTRPQELKPPAGNTSKGSMALTTTPPLAPQEQACVDVVVCVHNALAYVEQCLDSVLSKSTAKYRLIVVNDGSDQRTSDWLRSLASRTESVDLIETEAGPIGYTRAANVGLRATTGDYVVLLNSDTIVPRLWLESLLDCMTSDDRIGIVGPLSNAATWQSVPDFVDNRGRWEVNKLPPGYNVDEFSEFVFGVSERRFPRVPFLNGFCLMLRRDVIGQVGYLDEDSFPQGYGEENDLCLRTLDAGFDLAVADHCFVYHAKSKSFGASARDELAREGRHALYEKFGKERIEQRSDEARSSASLERIRRTIKDALE